MKTIAIRTSAARTLSAVGSCLRFGGGRLAGPGVLSTGFSDAAGWGSAAGFGFGSAAGFVLAAGSGTSALIGWFLRATTRNLEQSPTVIALWGACGAKWRSRPGDGRTGWSVS